MNQLLEKPSYPYDYAYSYYIQMFYIICFYGYLVPIIVPITIVAFAIQYWVDKRNILRKFSSPVDLGFSLTNLVWISLELSLLARAIGHMIWSIKLYHKAPSFTSYACNIASDLIALAYLIVILGFPKEL